jgi:hypothetical protein
MLFRDKSVGCPHVSELYPTSVHSYQKLRWSIWLTEDIVKKKSMVRKNSSLIELTEEEKHRMNVLTNEIEERED